MASFSHFTHFWSDGLFMVTDLQGCGLLLSDPAIHSEDRTLFREDTNLGQKGCDYSRGRMSDEVLRLEAQKMCQMAAQSNYAIQNHEDLNNVEDMRIHATMYPTNATNLYRACVAGIRRQKY